MMCKQGGTGSWWVQISAGRGPVECAWVVAQLCRLLREEAELREAKVTVLEQTPGPADGTYDSVWLRIETKQPQEMWLHGWTGTIQWIGRSAFRPQHKRKNWYVGLSLLSEHPSEHATYSSKDVRVEVMRSGGPGGQHVNKTESAVRLTHLPTGVQAIAREERLQYMNKKLAFARLFKEIEAHHQREKKGAAKERWKQHNTLERGNPTRVYRGQRWLRVR